MPSIIFDLDGTLIDSAPDIHVAVNLMLAAEGLQPLTLAEVTGFIGNGLPRLVELVMQHRGIDMARHADLSAQVLDLYNAGNGALTVLYPGVAECLHRLRQVGYVLGLCTNKPLVPTHAVLRHFGIAHLFAAVIGGDSLPQRKPDPAPLLRVIADLNTAGCVYVGDSEVDYDTAIAADVPFALYTEGYRKTPLDGFPAATPFDHFDDLPGLVAQLLHQ